MDNENKKAPPPSDSRDVQYFYYTKKVFNNPYIIISEYTYGIPKVKYMNGRSRLFIGKFCSISQGVEFIMSGNHPLDTVSTYPFAALKSDWPGATGESMNTKGDIVVGNDVWFGLDCMILSGVNIGDGAVIGAGAVVTKDVPPYGIVAGNPAVVKRKRFDEKIIKMLLEVKWWDWDIEKIKRNVNIISGKEIEKIKDCV